MSSGLIALTGSVAFMAVLTIWAAYMTVDVGINVFCSGTTSNVIVRVGTFLGRWLPMIAVVTIFIVAW